MRKLILMAFSIFNTESTGFYICFCEEEVCFVFVDLIYTPTKMVGAMKKLKIYKNCRDFLKICYNIAWSKKSCNLSLLPIGLPTLNSEDNQQ
jgi:hypothetical protein